MHKVYHDSCMVLLGLLFIFFCWMIPVQAADLSEESPMDGEKISEEYSDSMSTRQDASDVYIYRDTAYTIVNGTDAVVYVLHDQTAEGCTSFSSAVTKANQLTGEVPVLVFLADSVSSGSAVEIQRSMIWDLNQKTLVTQTPSTSFVKMWLSNVSLTVQNGTIQNGSSSGGFALFYLDTSVTGNTLKLDQLLICGATASDIYQTSYNSLILDRSKSGNQILLNEVTALTDRSIYSNDTSSKGTSDLTVTGGSYTITGSYYAVLFNSSGTASFDDVSMTKKNDSSGSTTCALRAANASFKNCTITSENTTCLQISGTASLEGCTITSGDMAVSVQNGASVTIESGTYSGERAVGIYASYGTLRLNGGTFSAAGSGDALYALSSGGTAVIDVYGGLIQGKMNRADSSSQITLYGGKYDLQPSTSGGAVPADGYEEIYLEGESLWTVALKQTAKIQVTDGAGNVTSYETLKEAVDSLNGGETVSILADLGTEEITIGRTLSFHLQGNDHSYSEPKAASGWALQKVESESNFLYTCIQEFVIQTTSSVGTSGTTVATVSGGGRYSAGAVVTLYAPQVSGYSFEGWYLDNTGTAVTTEQSYSFSAIADAGYTARYTAIEGKTFRLQVNASSFAVQIGSNPAENQTDTYQADVEPLKSVAVEYTGEDSFLYWKNRFGHIVGTAKKLQLNMVADNSFTAVTQNQSGSALVIFKSSDELGQELSAAFYTTEQEIVFPDAPVCYGRTFSQWGIYKGENNGSTEYWNATSEKIHELMQSGETTIVVFPLYRSADEHTLTIEYYDTFGNKITESSALSFKAGVPSLATANETITKGNIDYQFSHWLKGDQVVGTNLTHMISGLSDYTLRAVYASDEQFIKDPIRYLAVSEITSSLNGSRYRLSFCSSFSLPGSDQIQKRGFLYWNASEQKLTLENISNIRYTEWDSATANDNAMILHLTTADPDTVLYVRSFIILTDGTIIYSEPVQASYNSISNAAG